MTTNNTKRSRGRPKGGNSFTHVTIEQLQEFFGPNQAIPVSRVFLEKLNIQIDDAVKPIMQAQQQATNTERIAMTLEN